MAVMGREAHRRVTNGCCAHRYESRRRLSEIDLAVLAMSVIISQFPTGLLVMMI